ncbi:MAG: hypothetical protein IJV60_01290 [Prevotella sp.]|nr:hypothetical protein [Prevotella sp.]MBQ8058912.1 hypothetical protein [Prevotella sp.]MBQ8116324.1 hypothetical protein [Prevotella sp.]
MKKGLLLIIATLLTFISIKAQENTPNAKQARHIMETAYDNVFGKEGSSFSYNVNIVGIYKTRGNITIKEKKQRFTDDRVDSWNDGKTVYMAYRKKKTVEIHDPKSSRKDKHSGKFKFSLDDFTYSVARQSDGLMLTLKQKKGAKGTIKEVKALVAYKTYAPIRLRIKVSFFWTTINITNFKAGNINDKTFVFPRERYKDWKFVDKR